jgi:site-specific recombinase XerD
MGAVVRLRDVPQRQTPLRKPNAELRTREHLTEREVEKLVEAARGNRNGHRDATMILVAYRHGLRASELCDLRWDQVSFSGAVLHVRRRKAGTPSTHPLGGSELRALRRLKREKREQASQFVFMSERNAPFSTEGFARMLQRAAKPAGLTIRIHPPHAAARVRLQARQRRRRYPSTAELPRTQEHPAHGALHRASAGPLQGILEGLRIGKAAQLRLC